MSVVNKKINNQFGYLESWRKMGGKIEEREVGGLDCWTDRGLNRSKISFHFAILYFKIALPSTIVYRPLGQYTVNM